MTFELLEGQNCFVIVCGRGEGAQEVGQIQSLENTASGHISVVDSIVRNSYLLSSTTYSIIENLYLTGLYTKCYGTVKLNMHTHACFSYARIKENHWWQSSSFHVIVFMAKKKFKIPDVNWMIVTLTFTETTLFPSILTNWVKSKTLSNCTYYYVWFDISLRYFLFICCRCLKLVRVMAMYDLSTQQKLSSLCTSILTALRKIVNFLWV